MIFYIVGIVGLLVVSLITLFLPSFYSYSWGYANVEGVIGDASLSENPKIYYSLIDSFGWLLYIIFGLIAFCLIVFTIGLVVKKANITGLLPLICIMAMIPIGLLVIGTFQAKDPGQYIKVGSIVIGAGKNAGISEWGIICFVLLLVFYGLFAYGAKLVRKEIEKKGPKTIIVKAKETKQYTEEDFKL